MVSFTLQTRCATTCNIQVRAAQRELLAGDVSGNTGESGAPSASRSHPCKPLPTSKASFASCTFRQGSSRHGPTPLQCRCHPSLTLGQAAFHQCSKASLFGQIYRLDSADLDEKTVFLPVCCYIKSPSCQCFRSLTVYLMINFPH